MPRRCQSGSDHRVTMPISRQTLRTSPRASTVFRPVARVFLTPSGGMTQRKSSRPYCSKCGSKLKACLIPRRSIRLKLVASTYEKLLSSYRRRISRARTSSSAVIRSIGQTLPKSHRRASPEPSLERTRPWVSPTMKFVSSGVRRRRRISRASETARAWFRSLRSRSGSFALVSARMRASLPPPLRRGSHRAARRRRAVFVSLCPNLKKRVRVDSQASANVDRNGDLALLGDAVDLRVRKDYPTYERAQTMVLPKEPAGCRLEVLYGDGSPQPS